MAGVNLTALDVGETDLDVDALIALRTALTSPGCAPLVYLNVDRPLVQSAGEEALVHMAELLKENKTLRCLSLRKVNKR